MSEEIGAWIARLEDVRRRMEDAQKRLERLRGFHLKWLWVNRGFMLLDVALICWNLTTINKHPAGFATWFSGAVTALLCWSFVNTWKNSESRWREYLNELDGVAEHLQFIDKSIEQVKGLYAHQT